MTTLQAQRVIDALKEIGLKHGSWRSGGDFTASTKVKRRRMRDGTRYSEFHEAFAHTQNRDANKVIERNAQALADQELTVSLVYLDDRLVTAIVTSVLNRRRVVAVSRDGRWSDLSKAV